MPRRTMPLTAVTVTEIAASDWFIGDQSLVDLGRASHHEEAPADVWGYGGETQEHRAIAVVLAKDAETAMVFDGYRRFGIR